VFLARKIATTLDYGTLYNTIVSQVKVVQQIHSNWYLFLVALFFQDGHTLDTIQTEVRRRNTELEHLRKRVENEQTELDRLQQQRSSMAAMLNDMKRKHAALEKEKEDAEEKISELNQSVLLVFGLHTLLSLITSTQKDIETNIKTQQQKLHRVDKQLRVVENAVHSAEGRKSEIGANMQRMQSRVTG
jgi:chromosome segregation ATPase